MACDVSPAAMFLGPAVCYKTLEDEFPRCLFIGTAARERLTLSVLGAVKSLLGLLSPPLKSLPTQPEVLPQAFRVVVNNIR